MKLHVIALRKYVDYSFSELTETGKWVHDGIQVLSEMADQSGHKAVIVKSSGGRRFCCNLRRVNGLNE
ncbi:MAG: hypothetical protein JRJ68_03775 [Deltaproteobacteria bacterium]|nr:hypothetical protein [Deltaproteobacteria bacterium]